MGGPGANVSPFPGDVEVGLSAGAWASGPATASFEWAGFRTGNFSGMSCADLADSIAAGAC